MNGFNILAQTIMNPTKPTAQSSSNLPIDIVWEHITSLNLVEALTFISFGVVCLLYGWRVFKILVSISFGLFGLVIGIWINQKLIGGNVIWMAMISAILFVVLSIPFMRWGVSILGGLAGGILTSGAWLSFSLPQQYVWAGGLVGLVAGAMLSFIILKGAVMLFTALGGSGLVVTGVLAVFYRYMSQPENLYNLVYGHRWFLPFMIIVPLIVGIVLQSKFIKESQDWTV